MSNYVPMVTNTMDKTRSDIFSRLLEDRIIMVTGEVNAQMAELVTSQLLYLDSIDSEKPIDMYINSPGGSVIDGLAIFDTMRLVKAPVNTICVGMAASMGAFLLSSGALSPIAFIIGLITAEHTAGITNKAAVQTPINIKPVWPFLIEAFFIASLTSGVYFSPLASNAASFLSMPFDTTYLPNLAAISPQPQ